MGGVGGWDVGWISLMVLARRKGPGLHHCTANIRSSPFLVASLSKQPNLSYHFIHQQIERHDENQS